MNNDDTSANTTAEQLPSGAALPAMYAAIPPILNGTCVGDYIIETEISSGGFGTVYRARRRDRDVRAAIKVLHAELIGHENNVLRFEREVDVIRRLQHPNVVQLFDYGQLEDGRPYFAMELLSGEALDEYLEHRGRLSLQETLSILEPVVSALDMAHAQSVVHRDIKASNVFLARERGERRVVLLDFGIAKLLDSHEPSLTASRQIIGTLQCMAPEQLLGEPVDARTDIYALGVLAYSMLTGALPFNNDISSSLSPVGALYARPIPPSQRVSIDSAIDGPILHALAREPADRPATAGEFFRQLQSAAQVANQPKTPIQNCVERPGIAVHVEVRTQGMALEDPDEALLLDLESIFPFVSSALWEAGLLPVLETGNNLLVVSEGSDDPALSSSLRRRVAEIVVQTKEQLSNRPGRDARIVITFVVHIGALLVNESGGLLGGGLLDSAGWVPAISEDGIWLSEPFAEGLELAANVDNNLPGFLQMANA